MEQYVDTRVLTYTVWGIGTTMLYFFVLDGKYRQFLRRRDRRARRELTSAGALFLTALAANLAILWTLFGGPNEPVRGFLVSLALGAFFAAGVVMVTDRNGDGH